MARGWLAPAPRAGETRGMFRDGADLAGRLLQFLGWPSPLKLAPARMMMSAWPASRNTG
jgi:hypothetical protein